MSTPDALILHGLFVVGDLIEDGAVALVFFPLLSKYVHEGLFFREGRHLLEYGVVLMLGEFSLKNISIQVLIVGYQLSDCLMRLEEVQDALLMLLKLVDAHFTEISSLSLW